MFDPGYFDPSYFEVLLTPEGAPPAPDAPLDSAYFECSYFDPTYFATDCGSEPEPQPVSGGRGGRVVPPIRRRQAPVEDPDELLALI